MAPPTISAYGDAAEQYGELHLPDLPDLPDEVAPGARLPVAVLIHGGFWRARYGCDLMHPMAADLAARGRAVWNVEYRRVGQPGGGWPGTLLDVAAAVDHLVDLADRHPLDLADVVLIGHSAGGHLAAWAAGRGMLPPEAPGAAPRLRPGCVVGLGAVVDLVAAGQDRLGDGAAVDLLGGAPSEVPERYAVATPRVDPACRFVSVRGVDDDIVPARFTVPSGIAGATEVTEAVETIDVPGDHFALIDPASAAWIAVVAALPPGPFDAYAARR